MTQVITKQGIPLTVGRIRKWGTSHVLVIPPPVRERLGMLDGSLIAMRVVEPYATLTVWPAPRVPSPKDFSADQLPPLAEEARKRA
jgi:antitoxin component of MazEF toxin-antitoxin module